MCVFCAQVVKNMTGELMDANNIFSHFASHVGGLGHEALDLGLWYSKGPGWG